jgi:predicted DNA-binding protein (MmcQ/YjbR family)
VKVKCDPELALALRVPYAAICTGYHQDKRHWNTAEVDGSLSTEELSELIEHSYQLVVDLLPAAERTRLGET